jgi:hypothetical protein
VRHNCRNKNRKYFISSPTRGGISRSQPTRAPKSTSHRHRVCGKLDLARTQQPTARTGPMTPGNFSSRGLFKEDVAPLELGMVCWRAVSYKYRAPMALKAAVAAGIVQNVWALCQGHPPPECAEPWPGQPGSSRWFPLARARLRLALTHIA